MDNAHLKNDCIIQRCLIECVMAGDWWKQDSGQPLLCYHWHLDRRHLQSLLLNQVASPRQSRNVQELHSYDKKRIGKSHVRHGPTSSILWAPWLLGRFDQEQHGPSDKGPQSHHPCSQQTTQGLTKAASKSQSQTQNEMGSVDSCRVNTLMHGIKHLAGKHRRLSSVDPLASGQVCLGVHTLEHTENPMACTSIRDTTSHARLSFMHLTSLRLLNATIKTHKHCHSCSETGSQDGCSTKQRSCQLLPPSLTVTKRPRKMD